MNQTNQVNAETKAEVKKVSSIKVYVHPYKAFNKAGEEFLAYKTVIVDKGRQRPADLIFCLDAKGCTGKLVERSTKELVSLDKDFYVAVNPLKLSVDTEGFAKLFVKDLASFVCAYVPDVEIFSFEDYSRQSKERKERSMMDVVNYNPRKAADMLEKVDDDDLPF